VTGSSSKVDCSKVDCSKLPGFSGTISLLLDAGDLALVVPVLERLSEDLELFGDDLVVGGVLIGAWSLLSKEASALVSATRAPLLVTLHVVVAVGRKILEETMVEVSDEVTLAVDDDVLLIAMLAQVVDDVALLALEDDVAVVDDLAAVGVVVLPSGSGVARLAVCGTGCKTK